MFTKCLKYDIMQMLFTGMKEPMSIYINTFGLNKIPEDEIINIIRKI